MSFSLPYQIVPLGDAGLTIYLLTEDLCEAAHQQIRNLWLYLEQCGLPGVIEYVPAYVSLAIYYDVQQINFQQLKHLVHSQIQQCTTDSPPINSRCIQIPVCYDLEFAPDLERVAHKLELSIEQIIDLHTSRTYLVYMLGFIPGFAYLGTLPEALVIERHATPRLAIPPGSVGIAGYQTAIYPVRSPAGWQLIGRTPLELLNKNQNIPTLLQPGDVVSFQSIDKEQFSDLEKQQLC